MNNSKLPTLYFFSAHSMNAIPMVSGLMQELLSDFRIVVFHIRVKEYAQLPKGVVENTFATLKNRQALLRRTRLFNFCRYIYLYLRFLGIIFFVREKIFYCTDDTTARILLFYYKIFRKGKSTHIVYHEFENIDEINNRLFHQHSIFRNLPFQYIDLVIAPEENRLRLLLSRLYLPESKGMMIPNTCKVNDSVAQLHPVFQKIPQNTTKLLHVGSVGAQGHYFESVLKSLPDSWTLILVGMISEKLKQVYLKYKETKNIIWLDQVPHQELQSLYQGADLGLILYKGMDQNYEFCAPNKLYELWSSGIPVIGHKLKGLEGVFKHSFQGALFDFEDPELTVKLKAWKERFDARQASIELKSYFRTHLQIDRFARELADTLKQFQNEENLVSRRYSA